MFPAVLPWLASLAIAAGPSEGTVAGAVGASVANADRPPVGCTAAVPASHILRFLDVAELRLQQLEDTEFAAAMDAATASLGCLGEPLTREQSARWHQLRGVRRYQDGQAASAAAHFRAYAALARGGSLPSTWAAEGGKLLTFYRVSVAEADGAPRVLVPPDGRSVRVDGQEALVVPWGRAAVLQLLDGEVVLATLEFGGQEIPPDLGSFAPPPSPPPVAEASRRRPVGLVAASAATALLAGGSYAASWYLRGRFDDLVDDPVPVADIDALRGQTNATALAAPVLGVTALGLGVVAVVRW